jgi:anthranilate phosphoribosyltransferase
VVGVYSESLVEPLAGALLRLGAERALVVHGDDGLDELTTTAPSHAALVADGGVQTLTIEPETLGLARSQPGDLTGGDAQQNARTTLAILAGEEGPQRDIVLLNAAAALWVVGAACDLEAGLQRAAVSIDSGAAAAKLEALREATERIGEALSA